MNHGLHTTNYTNTFIAVADDCPVSAAVEPPQKAPPTVATRQFELLANHPYRYTSDEVLFAVFAEKKGFGPEELEEERHRWLSKGQPCLRTSPLGKTYGWGIHHDAQARVALYPLGSEDYQRLRQDPGVAQTKAMRSRR